MKITKTIDYSLVEAFLKKNFSAPTHWPDWNLTVSKHFHTDFYYFLAFEKDELLGICPVHKTTRRFINDYRSGQFKLIPFGGWIFSKKVKFNISKIPLQQNESFRSYGLPLLQEFTKNTMINFDEKCKTLILDLDEELDVIWKNQLSRSKRKQIRRAENKHIVIETGCDSLEKFYLLYKQACLRNKLSLLPMDFFIELFNNSNNIQFDIITAKYNDNYLANKVVVFDKNYSIAWLGNKVNDAPNLGQGELLHWEAIKRMKEFGCKYYDFCYIEEKRLPEIYKFKRGFSKKEVLVPLNKIKPLEYKILNRLSLWF